MLGDLLGNVSAGFQVLSDYDLLANCVDVDVLARILLTVACIFDEVVLGNVTVAGSLDCSNVSKATFQVIINVTVNLRQILVSPTVSPLLSCQLSIVPLHCVVVERFLLGPAGQCHDVAAIRDFDVGAEIIWAALAHRVVLNSTIDSGDLLLDLGGELFRERTSSRQPRQSEGGEKNEGEHSAWIEETGWFGPDTEEERMSEQQSRETTAF